MEIVRLLLKQGADHTPDILGMTPFYKACSHGNVEVARVLIENGATMQRSLKGTDPLTIACWHGKMDLIKFLLENGADVNAEPDSSGYSPIIMAARRRHYHVVRYLLRQGTNPFVYTKVSERF